MDELKIGIEVLEARADEIRCEISDLFYTRTPNASATDDDLFLIPDMVMELNVVLGKISALRDTLDAVQYNVTCDPPRT